MDIELYNNQNNTEKESKIILCIKIIIIIANLLLLLFIEKKIYVLKNYTFSLNDIIQQNKICYKAKQFFLFKDDIIKKSNHKNKIHISMAINSKGFYSALVSMVSALENNNKINNILVYHLLLSHDFNKNFITTFDSLKNKYEVKIYYYIIPDIFKNYRSWFGGNKTIYFKLLLPFIMNKLERIIYLDADTLIFKDILEMYNLPFNDNYALGYPFHDVFRIDKFVKNATYYINGGVILFNLKKIRNDKKDFELVKFTLENNRNLFFLEQDSINVVYFQKVWLLPLKYGIYLYGTIESFEKKIEHRIRFKLNRTEIIDAINDPSIVHFSCCNPKIWYNSSRNEFGVDSICKRFYKEFYYYANKTDIYSEIYRAFNG
jgi:lipopolysaccharide biosynthesis glycosyltransferase